MFGLYTVKDCGGHNFERLAVSLYGSYRWFKTIFRILRHHSFTGKRPKLIQENHEISPTLIWRFWILFFYEYWHFLKLKCTKLVEFRSLKLQKTSWLFKIDFTENLSNRKILKFPQRDLCSAFETVKRVIYDN